MPVLAALLAGLLAQDGFADLLRQLLDDDPDRRDRAGQALVDGWSRWTEADLGRMRALASGRDPESSDRARAALARIEIRRRVGAPSHGFLAGIDEDLLRGTPEQRLDLLRKAGILRDVGRLDDRQLAGLVEGVAQNEWPLPARGVLELVTTGDRRSASAYLPLLPPLLRDPDPELALAAIRAAGAHRASRFYPALAARLADRSFDAALIDALGHTGARPVAADVAAFLSGPSRGTAAEILGRMGAIAHAPAVARLLESGDPDLLRIAATALGRMASREHRPALQALLVHEDRDVRLAAAEALGRLGDPDATLPLVPLLKDLDGGVREGASEALERLAAPAAVEPLLGLLGDRDPVARGLAARVLARCGTRDHASAIAGLLVHDHPWSRAEAIRAFGRLGAVDQAERLAQLLGDEWAVVRAASALSLADLGRPAPIDRLRERRKDFSALVRRAAEVALARLSDEERPEALIDGLDYEDAEAVESLLETLERARAPRLRERLDREIALEGAVESLDDLQAALRKAGLVFENPDDLLMAGRHPSGRTTPRRLLSFFWPGLTPVPTADRVRLATASEALDHWRGPR